MARKPKAETAPTVDPLDMLSLIDQDAPEGGAVVIIEQAEPLPPAVIARRAAAIVLQNPERFDQFHDRIRERMAEFVPDLTTAKGRAEIASKAFEVTKLKTSLDKAGLELTEDWRRKTKAVNDARKPMVERLAALADEVRAPLTEWEAKESERLDANAATLAAIRNAATVSDDDTSITVADRGRETYLMAFDAPQWTDEEAAEAEGAKQATVQALMAARDRLRQQEKDAAELAELRAAAAARAEADRIAEEARIEREAAEKAAAEQAEREAQAERDAAAAAEAARVAAEQEAERLRLEAEQRARDEAARLEQAAKDAADAARKAAEEAAAEAQRQRDAEHAAALQAAQDERDRIAREAQEREAERAAADAERERLAQVERLRLEDEQRTRDEVAAAIAEADRLRLANAEHRRAVIADVASDIMAAIPGLSDDMGRDLANALASGQVRNVTVAF